MLKRILIGLVVALSVGTFTASAADDPSMHDIYEAANSGKLQAAQDMITTVLRDHPNSAKAHYVAAELDARQGRLAEARSQLQSAEQLEPGLSFAKPESVRALKSQLGGTSAGGGSSSLAPRYAAPVARSGGMSTGMLIGLVALIGFIVWMVVRRRAAPQPSGYPVSSQPGYGPGYGGPGGYPQGGPGGGGIGSGIAGGLASGLAVGAGVVAGEAIAHRLMGDGERERYVDVPPDRSSIDSNSNMGGNDFGINDSSSWDDSSSSSGGGDDDWS
jgi:hypothetical protein